MEFEDSRPIYLQITDDIKKKIINGSLQEGEKLPSVREYCAEYAVTSLTMQRAMARLEDDGVTRAQKGVGSFVCPGVVRHLMQSETQKAVAGFVQDMRAMGYSSAETLAAVEKEFTHGNSD